jgi:hypothetical protein
VKGRDLTLGNGDFGMKEMFLVLANGPDVPFEDNHWVVMMDTYSLQEASEKAESLREAGAWPRISIQSMLVTEDGRIFTDILEV